MHQLSICIYYAALPLNVKSAFTAFRLHWALHHLCGDMWHHKSRRLSAARMPLWRQKLCYIKHDTHANRIPNPKEPPKITNTTSHIFFVIFYYATFSVNCHSVLHSHILLLFIYLFTLHFSHPKHPQNIGKHVLLSLAFLCCQQKPCACALFWRRRRQRFSTSGAWKVFKKYLT